MDTVTDVGYEIFKMTLHADYFLRKFRDFQENFNFINRDLCLYLQDITKEIENYIDNKPDIYCLDDQSLIKYDEHKIMLYSFAIKFYCITCKEKVNSKNLETHMKNVEHNKKNLNQEIDQADSGNYCSIEPLKEITNEVALEKINEMNLISTGKKQKKKIKKQTKSSKTNKINLPPIEKKKIALDLETNNQLFKEHFIKVMKMKTIYCNLCQNTILDQYISKHTDEEKHKKEYSQKRVWQEKNNIYGLKNLKVYVCRICKMKFIQKKNAIYNHVSGEKHLTKKKEWELTRNKDLLWREKCPCSCEESDDDDDKTIIKRKKIQKKRFHMKSGYQNSQNMIPKSKMSIKS